MEKKYKPISQWRYKSMRLSCRPVNARSTHLITQDHKTVENFNQKDKFDYKLGLSQLVTNLAFVSGRHQLRNVKGKVPTSTIKRLIHKYH